MLNIIMIFPFVVGMVIFARPVISLFFPTGYEGLAFQYVLRYARFYLAFLYVQMVGHILHAYMRSLGNVNVVLGITLVGSTVRVVATLWLVALIGMDGVFIGQIISWAVDAVISTVIYLLHFRTHEQIIKRLAEKKKKKEQQQKKQVV